MLAGERCGGAGGLATSRTGDGGRSFTARRGERMHRLVREERGHSGREEPSCDVVRGVLHGYGGPAVVIHGARAPAPYHGADSGAACTRSKVHALHVSNHKSQRQT